MKSMFITFEGNDGSGKSSVIEAIREELTKRGYDIVLTREPGGSKIAEKYKNVAVISVITDPDGLYNYKPQVVENIYKKLLYLL